MNNKFKIVEVEWFDAQISLDATTIDQIKSNLPGFIPQLTKTVGYLIYQTSDYIVLAYSYFTNETIQYHQIIPKGIIKHMRELKHEKGTKRIRT